jgi:type I restriction enzyme S subunit
MVPDGWRQAHVGELISSIDAGVSVNSKSIPAAENQIGVLKTSCVSDGIFAPERNKWVKEVEEQNRVREHVRANTIIMSRMNTPDLVGANAYVDAEYSNLFLPDRLWALKPINGHVHCRWLAYWLGSAHTRFTISRIATGTSGSMKNITQVDVLALKIWVPPLPEQKKIAEILATWDKAIETTEKLLANAEAQKRALMQQLLTGKRRLPGFEGREWRKVAIGEIADVDRSNLGSKTSPDFEFDYISLSDVEPGRIIEPLQRYCFAAAPSRARRLVEVGDILVSTVRPNLLGFARITPRLAKCVASTGFAVLSPRKSADGSYLMHYMFSHHMRAQLHSLVMGSNYPAVNSNEIKRLEIRIPELPEQTRIAQILDACDDEISILSDDLIHLRKEKRALMQQLLTGKKRVKV